MQQAAPLFRPAAIQSAAGNQIGAALQVHWRMMRVLTTVAACLVVALFGFIATVEYSPVNRVPCYTDVRAGLARLSAPIGGQVKLIAVAEGAIVRKGDLLAVLGSDRLSTDGGSQHASLRQKLASEQEMIGREIAAAEEEAAASRLMIVRRLAGLRAEQAALRADLEASERLLASRQAQTDKIAAIVAQGYATELQLMEKRDEIRLQESKVAATRGALMRGERDIATSEAELRLVEARRNGAIEGRRRDSGELERLMVQADADAEQAIRAPMDGVVSTALIAPGQSITAGQSLFTVAPIGEPLVMRLMVPARAAASVRPGIEIKIVFSAYPQEKFGEFAARVYSVSDTPSLPLDVQRIFPVREPVFIAVASLPAELRSPAGRTLKLKPGMLADALVPIERRTVLEWLLEPLLRGFNENAARTSTPAMEANAS
jgi:membrane fusion protein